jgi:hypothetical protein
MEKYNKDLLFILFILAFVVFLIIYYLINYCEIFFLLKLKLFIWVNVN